MPSDLDRSVSPPAQDHYPSPAPIEPQTNLSGWIFAAFLLAIAVIACTLGFLQYRFQSQKLAQKTAAIAPRPVVPIKPRPLTENDVERIFSLPLQAQAEELLERSIQHDPRALQLLEQHLGDFKGRVRESPRMKNLLNRAQYSRDLRVRYAYCDMVLGMDGWSKDADAVQILIQRAQNDPSSRAYDVWYLGMLGGRGVKPELVRTTLLNYAHNDPDDNVRLWATEGLRFQGTDQVLDDLFQIFVSDPTFSVRDRAGCNVSDCGNFMRKQRMRMFPRFLELAENPTANGQMRNWSFLAMQGITDVNLPPDAKAWRRWYDLHGAEKMAEFQSIPEWQVRGDE